MDDAQPKNEDTANEASDASKGTVISVSTGNSSAVQPTTEVQASVVGNDFTAPSAPVLPTSAETSTVQTNPPVANASVAVEPNVIPSELPTDNVMPDLANESDTPPNDVAAPTPSVSQELASIVPSAATAVKKKKSGMGLIIAVVSITTLALAAVGYFALTNKDEEPKTPATSTTTTEETTEVEDTPDTSSAAIDDSLKEIDDTKDFSSTDLNDTTLGL